MQFIPTENFDYVVKDETGTERLVASYVAGHSYHCRTPEMEQRALQWEVDGKVTTNGQAAAPVAGTDAGV